MSLIYKTFDAYIKELIYHPKRAPKWLADKRLSVLEKKILQGHLLVRENKNSKVIEDLQNVSSSEFDFVKDHLNLLLGICHNNIGSYSESEKLLSQAVDGFFQKNQDYHQFTALFNLFMVLSNSGKNNEMAPVLKKMKEICPDLMIAKIRLIRCEFIFAVDTNDTVAAKKLVHQIAKIKSNFSESDLGEHLVCEFMYYIKHEKFESAQGVLEEMKKRRNFSTTENYNFMKELLSHLTTDKTLYVYEREFPANSYLFKQMKVIESFQASNREEALKWWNILQTDQPQLYKEEFHFAGDKCLFSLCLDKHLKRSKTPLQLPIMNNSSKVEIIYNLLSKVDSLRKEHLYELVYGEPAVEKADFIKLANLISKVRKFYGSEIMLKKGAYTLEKKKKVRLLVKAV